MIIFALAGISIYLKQMFMMPKQTLIYYCDHRRYHCTENAPGPHQNYQGNCM